MFKTILSVVVVGVFSMATYADDTSDIDALMQELPIGDSAENLSLDELNDLLSFDINEEAPKIDMMKELVDLKEIDPVMEIENFENTESLLNIEFDSSDLHADITLDILDSSLQLSNSKFLKYIPVKTELKFNKTIIIPSTKRSFIFSIGEPKLKVEKEQFSFCYIKFSKSDATRQILKDRQFLIKKNITKKAIISSSNKSVYFSTLYIENKNIDYVKCLSNQQKTPLTVKDFDSHFGGLIEFVWPAYDSI